MTPAPRRGLRAAARPSHDRWLVSYADLVTLLLAFFTTLYAASTMDATKLGPLTNSLNAAFDTTVEATAVRPEGVPTLVPPVEIMARLDAMNALRRQLSSALAEAITEGRVELIQDARGLVISMPDDAAFPSGGADMTAAARVTIERVAATIQTLANPIRIEGHTDDVPIRTERFGSNWELSTARASAVVAHLVTSGRIDPARLSASGYGEFHPRVPNTSPGARARNRRIDIVVLEPR